MRFPLLAAAGRRPLETSQSYKTLHIWGHIEPQAPFKVSFWNTRVGQFGHSLQLCFAICRIFGMFSTFVTIFLLELLRSTTVVYWPPCQPLDHHYKVTAYQPIRFSPTKYQNYANCLFCSRNFLFQADTLAAACSLHVDSVPATGR